MDRVGTTLICVFLVNLVVHWPHVFAQEGFVSLACGREQRTSYTDSNGIKWIPDEANISTGEKDGTVQTGEAGQSLRFFPFWRKNCYSLDVISGNRYLVRGTFMYYDYDSWSRPPQFDVAIDATLVFTVETTLDDTQVREVIVTAQRNDLSYCLLTRPSSGYPVISSLELRPLSKSAYPEAEHSILSILSRVDAGNIDRDVRYPNDKFDRIWSKEPGTVDSVVTVENLTLTARGDHNVAPDLVLANARLADDTTRRFTYTYTFTRPNPQYPFLVFLYLAELNRSTRIGDRIFSVTANGIPRGSYDILNLSQDASDNNLAQFSVPANESLTLTFEALQGSRELPSLNAMEIYEVIQVANGTQAADVQALMDVKNTFVLLKWSGDPCLPALQGENAFAPWEGVTCDMQDDVITITGLDLSNQHLEGAIPRGIDSLRNLKHLNLSNNELIELPNLSGLSSLIILDLRNNSLQGDVPYWLGDLPNLKTLLLDGNQFRGEIPSNLVGRNDSNFTFSFSDNPLLQGSVKSSKSGNTLLKTFIGALLGAIGLLLVMAMAIFAYCYHKQRARVGPRLSGDKAPGPNYVMKVPHQYPVYLDFQSLYPQELSLKEVEIVTGLFKSKIGEGGFGAVYYGTLPDGTAVAVKVRSVNSSQGTREFTTELDLLRQVEHENLVPLVGYCKEQQQQILIYPYMSNGSLHDRLYDKGAGRKPLDWQTRLNIVLGAARGLNFLHNGGDRCIIHRDVKSSNILLDDSMKGKIADFGLSKYSPIDGESIISTEVRGTAGYLDPEYYSTQQLTEKSDVYSFGIVLLETVCGREPLNSHLPREEWSLLEWVRPFIKDSNIHEIVDPAISQSYTPESLWRVLEVALQSVESHSSRRPTIADIVRELEDALIIENNASQYMASIQSLDSLCVPSIEMRDLTMRKVPSSYPPFEPSSVFSDTMDGPEPR